MITCILSFNHPQLTARTLHSVLKFVPAEHVLLVHNGSLAEHEGTLREQFPQIHHRSLKENRGFSGGANFGLKESFELSPSGWVTFVTNDCELLTQPVAPEVPGLYAPLIYRRKVGVVDSLGGVFYTLSARLEHIRETTRAKMMSQPHQNRRWFRYFYVPGTAFVVHRSHFETLGGFDETLHTYWEDVDLSVRARRKGLHLGILPEVELVHKVGKTCHKDKFYTTYLFQRNRRILKRRYWI